MYEVSCSELSFVTLNQRQEKKSQKLLNVRQLKTKKNFSCVVAARLDKQDENHLRPAEILDMRTFLKKSTIFV